MHPFYLEINNIRIELCLRLLESIQDKSSIQEEIQLLKLKFTQKQVRLEELQCHQEHLQEFTLALAQNLEKILENL